jgi:hypothetical protein
LKRFLTFINILQNYQNKKPFYLACRVKIRQALFLLQLNLLFMKYRFYFLFFLTIICSISSFSQGLLAKKSNFTRQDSLRGSITPERIWWDLTYYHLEIKVDPNKNIFQEKHH